MSLSIFNEKQITSFIPGVIVDVKVTTGQKVKKGETLVILDAMKMNNRIIASTDGTVKAINVKKGDRVPKDFVMVELE